MEEDAGSGALGGEPGLSPGTTKKTEVADAERAVAKGGVVRRRGVGRGRRKTEVRTEGTGRAEGRGLQATGGVGLTGRQGKEMVVDRRRGSVEQGTNEGTRRVNRWR